MVELVSVAWLPAVIAMAVVYGCQRLAPEHIAKRYTMALGMGVAFLVGYLMLPSWASLVPTRHWQWLPWLGLSAMVVGPIAFAAGVSLGERWLLYLLLSIVAAWLFVPNWSSLDPPRSTYIAFLSGYLFLLTVCLEPLPGRVSSRLLLVTMAISGGGVAAVIAALVSLRYGQLATVAAAAMAGCGIAAFLKDGHCLTTRALMPTYAILIGGSAFVGLVEPEQPLLGLALIPFAPATLWPTARFKTRAMVATQIAVVLAFVCLAAVFVWHGQK